MRSGGRPPVGARRGQRDDHDAQHQVRDDESQREPRERERIAVDRRCAARRGDVFASRCSFFAIQLDYGRGRSAMTALIAAYDTSPAPRHEVERESSATSRRSTAPRCARSSRRPPPTARLLSRRRPRLFFSAPVHHHLAPHGHPLWTRQRRQYRVAVRTTYRSSPMRSTVDASAAAGENACTARNASRTSSGPSASAAGSSSATDDDTALVSTAHEVHALHLLQHERRGRARRRLAFTRQLAGTSPRRPRRASARARAPPRGGDRAPNTPGRRSTPPPRRAR